MLKELLVQLEKESDAINVASGRKIAMKIAKELPSYKSIIAYTKLNDGESVQLLEKVEEVASRQTDEQYANPNDNFVFSLLLILKDLYNAGVDGANGQFSLAKDAADQMKNSWWTRTVRHENFLEHLYDICGVSRSDAMDELYCTIPELLSARDFERVNAIMVEMDLKRVTTSIMYGMLNMLSSYVNQLPHYKDFWVRVRQEFMDRRNNPEAEKMEERTEKQIDDLIGQLKDGPGSPNRLFDPDAKPYEPYDKKYERALQEKIDWAKDFGDKDLLNYLIWYQERSVRDKEKDNKFRTMRARLGDKETNRRAAEALRAMADKLEQGGMHFMIGCDLPELPIFSGKEYVSHIEVTVAAGPMGG